MGCRRRGRLGCAAVLTALLALAGYARWVEPYRLVVEQQEVTAPGLPAGWDGLRIVQLSDLHLGPWISLDYLNRALALANAQSPDLIVLTGDYVRKSPRYISPIYAAMAQLRAPLGVYGVLGNHDQWEDNDLRHTREAMRRAGIGELTNRGVALERGGDKLWLGGVADVLTGHPDLGEAMVGAPEGATAILLSHNPDFIDKVHDPRVKLMLSGHTHGGQVNLPWAGPLVVPSIHGKKYAGGLVQAGATQVYVTRGVGMAVLPVRLRCRPEVTVLTLRGG